MLSNTRASKNILAACHLSILTIDAGGHEDMVSDQQHEVAVLVVTMRVVYTYLLLLFGWLAPSVTGRCAACVPLMPVLMWGWRADHAGADVG